MENKTIFLYIILTLSLLYAAYNGVFMIIKRGKTSQTTGTIISIISPNPETAKARNSKWAKVTYRVNGKIYTSQNRVQVPMTAQVGSAIKIRYDTAQPDRLYGYSLLKIFVSLIIAAICMTAAIVS